MKSLKKNILFLYFFLLFFKNINAQGTQTFQGIRFFHPNTSGQYISLLPPNGITSYGLTLPATQGAANTLILNDGSGNLSWNNGSGLFWSLTGNGATTDGTHFIGTTNNVPFNIRVNNQKSGRIETGGGINAFGYQAGATSTATFGNTYIGHRAGYATTANNNTFVGYNTGTANITGANNAFFGTNAGPVNTATDNTFLGFKAGLSNTSGQTNTFVGSQAGELNSTGNNNTFLGFEAGKRSTTSDNNYIGYQAGRENATGDKNIAIGKHAFNLGTAGSNNVAIGFQAGYNSNANNNTAIGHQAGMIINTGANNTFLGYAADALSPSFTNSAAIGYNAKVGASNSMVLGGTGTDAVNVGIGLTIPSNKLHVNATDPLRLEGLTTATAGDKSLTVDATGIVHQKDAPTYVDVVNLTGTTAITTNTVSVTAGASALGSLNTVIYTTTFTLTRASIILVDANIASKSILTTGGAMITDGSPRLIRTFWNFSGSTVRYGANSTMYMNTQSDVVTMSGALNNNSSFFTTLAAGTYTLELNLTIVCSSGRNMRATYGNDISDRINIKAIQL